MSVSPGDKLRKEISSSISTADWKSELRIIELLVSYEGIHLSEDILVHFNTRFY